MSRAEPGTYVTDLTHFDGVLAPASTAPAPAKRLAAFLTELVRVATRERIGTVRTDVRCFKKPARRACTGKVVTMTTRGQEAIRWECPSCGNNGVIRNWRGSEADLSRYAPTEVEVPRKRANSGKAFEGSWRITEMELWDEDAVELLGPGYFRFDEELSGEFQFVAVRGSLE